MDRREERGLLNTARWISAGMVAVGHAWACLFARQDTLISKTLWALSDTRHSWVIIFFVLSGYLVGGNVLLRADRFDVGRYALARFTRIYIVLIPALLLTAALDGAAYLLAPHSPIYATPWAQGVISDPAPFFRYGPREILASVLSLENVVGGTMGSNGPLWSLGFEWIFYFCFPAFLMAADAIARRIAAPLWLMRGAVLLATLALLVGTHKPYAALLWLIWISGALAHVVMETGRWPRPARWTGLGVCAIGFVLGLYINYRLADVLIGFGAASFLCLFPRGERGVNPGLDRALSGGSYSLYVIHMPILAFVAMLYNQRGLLPPGGAPMSWTALAMLAGVVVTVGLAVTLFHRLFEANTDALRATLSRRLAPTGVAHKA